MRNIIQHEEATEILKPHFETLYNCITEGFNDYLSLINHVNGSGSSFINYNSRTKANIIHCNITSRMEQSFADMEGIRSGVFNKFFSVNFDNKLILKVKKLDNKYNPSFIPTDQANNYNAQIPIEGIGDNSTFLYAGYTVNPTYTSIKGIYIICRINEELEWMIDLSQQIITHQGNLSFVSIPEEPKPTTSKRISIKKGLKDKQTGTENK